MKTTLQIQESVRIEQKLCNSQTELTPWEINKENQPLIRRRDPFKIRLWVYDHTPTWYVLNERIISGPHYIPTYQLTDRESSAKGTILK